MFYKQAHGQCEVTCDPAPGHTTPDFTRFGFMPDGVACTGGSDLWDLDNWPRNSGSYYMCLNGLCQVYNTGYLRMFYWFWHYIRWHKEWTRMKMNNIFTLRGLAVTINSTERRTTSVGYVGEITPPVPWYRKCSHRHRAKVKFLKFLPILLCCYWFSYHCHVVKFEFTTCVGGYKYKIYSKTTFCQVVNFVFTLAQ